MDLHKINFWKRLEMFVENVQVNDAMSEEEKEMIIRIAQDEQNSHKHGVMQAEGSDGAKGAAVASEGLEKHVRGGCIDRTRKKDGPCCYPVGTCDDCQVP